MVSYVPKKKGDQYMTEKKVYRYDWAGRPLIIEVGQLAKQANGAVLVR